MANDLRRRERIARDRSAPRFLDPESIAFIAIGSERTNRSPLGGQTHRRSRLAREPPFFAAIIVEGLRLHDSPRLRLPTLQDGENHRLGEDERPPSPSLAFRSVSIVAAWNSFAV